MRKPTLVCLILLLCSLVWSQEKPAPKTAYHPVPIVDVRRPNPVKPTPESIASGKKIYGYDCAICHGEDGVGKTNAGKQMKIPDLTDPAVQKQRTDGEYFYVIKNGRNEMPLEGDRVKTDQMWDLVNYVRTLEKKKSATEEKPPS